MSISHSASAPPVPVRAYLMVFAALLALTVVTVAVASFDLSERATVVVAVTIATLKAALVAMFFMHLKGEKPFVFWSLGLTAVLFAALFAFLLWTEGDRLAGTRFLDAFGSAPKAPPADGSVTPRGEGGH